MAKVKSNGHNLKIFCTFLLVFLTLPIINSSFAIYASEQFKTDYFVDYFLTETEQNISSRVSFHIKITNLTSDLIIKNFSLTFPEAFQIGNIKANDDFTSIIPQVRSDANQHKIALSLSNPVAGLGEENNIYLDFLQQNLFKVNGNVWEVILPTIERKDGEGNYTIKVHLPPNSSKKISIAKPKPDHITIGEITWKNPTNKTVYAVFGDTQNYNLQLRYHLSNPKFMKVYTDIAFPPDTLYQKLFVESIKPEPDMAYTDENGNFLGRYYLNPQENKEIFFNGGVTVYTQPRSEMLQPINDLFITEKKGLLSVGSHWNVSQLQYPKTIRTVEDIYSFVTSTLTYNYSRLNTTITRLGANDALIYPDQAVCTEYSDLFIAIAREKGIYARELQGYGFSHDPNLRPISANADVLHSWPEYFDSKQKRWIQIDPTWEDTSGIDYFSSFDLNHIVFAIHGKKSDYPFPAGSYKQNSKSKDINIQASSSPFEQKRNLSIEVHPYQLPSFTNNSASVKITVKNTGSGYEWNIPVKIEAKGVTFSQNSKIIQHLAPHEKKDLQYEYQLDNPFSFGTILLKVSANTDQHVAQTIQLYSAYITIGKYILAFVCIIFGLLIAARMLK